MEIEQVHKYKPVILIIAGSNVNKPFLTILTSLVYNLQYKVH